MANVQTVRWVRAKGIQGFLGVNEEYAALVSVNSHPDPRTKLSQHEANTLRRAELRKFQKKELVSWSHWIWGFNSPLEFWIIWTVTRSFFILSQFEMDVFNSLKSQTLIGKKLWLQKTTLCWRSHVKKKMAVGGSWTRSWQKLWKWGRAPRGSFAESFWIIQKETGSVILNVLVPKRHRPSLSQILFTSVLPLLTTRRPHWRYRGWGFDPCYLLFCSWCYECCVFFFQREDHMGLWQAAFREASRWPPHFPYHLGSPSSRVWAGWWPGSRT